MLAFETEPWVVVVIAVTTIPFAGDAT